MRASPYWHGQTNHDAFLSSIIFGSASLSVSSVSLSLFASMLFVLCDNRRLFPLCQGEEEASSSKLFVSASSSSLSVSSYAFLCGYHYCLLPGSI